MKIKLLILIVVSIIISTNSCKESDCNGEPEAILLYEDIYLNIVDKQGENVFINGFSIDSLKIFENNQKLSFEYSNSVIKFRLSSGFYNNVENSLDKEIIENVFIQYDNNIVDTIIIKTTPKYYPDECQRTDYFNVRVFYNSNSVIENSNSTCLFCTYQSRPLILSRP